MLEIRIGIGDDPATCEENRFIFIHDRATQRNSKLTAIQSKPSNRRGIPAAIEILVTLQKQEGLVAG